MIQMLSQHPPLPLFPKKEPPLPPQQQSSRMIQMMLLHPHPLSFPHPQFVAAKSLIVDSLQIFIYSSYYVGCLSLFHAFLRKIML